MTTEVGDLVERSLTPSGLRTIVGPIAIFSTRAFASDMGRRGRGDIPTDRKLASARIMRPQYRVGSCEIERRSTAARSL